MRHAQIVLISVILFVKGHVLGQDRTAKELPTLAGGAHISIPARLQPRHTKSPVFQPEYMEWSTSYKDYNVNAPVFDIQFVRNGGWGNPILCGSFDSVGGNRAMRVARYWDIPDTISQVGNGIDNGSVYALLALSDTDIYAGGRFSVGAGSNIVHFDGNTWSPLGTGTDSSVLCLELYDGYIFAGGNFTHAGGIEANHIAAWDPVARQWHAIVDAAVNGVDGGVAAMALSQYGLFVGGGFVSAGSKTVNKIALYNKGVDPWTPLGSGIAGKNSFVASVSNTRDFRGGTSLGGDFLVCGSFDTVNGNAAANIAIWSGYSSDWSTENHRSDGPIFRVTSTGSATFVGGSFTSVDGGVSLNISAVTDGNIFDMQGGTDGLVYAIAGIWPFVALAPTGMPLFVGGNFSQAGGKHGPNFAIFYGESESVQTNDNSGYSLSLSPNPASTSTRVSLPQECKELVIADELGRIRMRLAGSDVLQTTASLDVRLLERGSYTVACTTPNGIYRSTLLIQR